MQSNGILKLVQKVKFILVFHNIDLQNLAKFGHWEGQQFEFENLDD
jgi:hypothetical protein